MRRAVLSGLYHGAKKTGHEAEIVGILADAVKDSDTNVAAWAVHFLGYIGIKARVAVPVLMNNIYEKTLDIKGDIIKSLIKIIPEPEVLAFLKKVVRDGDIDDRFAAIHGFRRLTPCEDIVQEYINVISNDPDPHLKSEAAESLNDPNIQAYAFDAIPILEKASNDAMLPEKVRSVLARTASNLRDYFLAHKNPVAKEAIFWEGGV